MEGVYARMLLPGACSVLLLVEACFGDQSARGNASLCCALCCAIFMESVAYGTAMSSALCTQIVKSASDMYRRANPEGKEWMLDLDEALKFSEVNMGRAGVVVQGAIPPTDKSLAPGADIFKYGLHLPLAFSLEMVRYVVEAAVSCRALHVHCVNIGAHYVGLVADGRKGPGRCVVKVYDSYGSISPFFIGHTNAVQGQIVVYTLAENSIDLPAGNGNVSMELQTAFDAVYDRQQPQQSCAELSPEEYVPMYYQLFHFLMGYVINGRLSLDSALRAHEVAKPRDKEYQAAAVSQAFRFIEIVQLAPTASFPSSSTLTAATSESVVLAPSTPTAAAAGPSDERPFDSITSSSSSSSEEISSSFSMAEIPVAFDSETCSFEKALFDEDSVEIIHTPTCAWRRLTRCSSSDGGSSTTTSSSSSRVPSRASSLLRKLSLVPSTSQLFSDILAPNTPPAAAAWGNLKARCARQSIAEEGELVNTTTAATTTATTATAAVDECCAATPGEKSAAVESSAAIATCTAGPAAAAASECLGGGASSRRSLLGRAAHKISKRCKAAGRKCAGVFMSCLAAPSVAQ